VQTGGEKQDEMTDEFGSTLAMERDSATIDDLHEREQAVFSQSASAPAASFGNPFWSATAGLIAVSSLTGIFVMFVISFSVIPLAGGDVALADRTFLKYNCTTCQTMKGIQGIQGIQGLPGKDGVNGQNGLNGTAGAPGICVPNPLYPCAKGDQGIQGIQGIQGNPGTGIQGEPGIQGIQGLPGYNGTDGRNGTDGINGTDGAPGPPGPPFNGDANFTSVFINGTTTCAVPIDVSCLGPGGCSNFSLCSITTESILVQGVDIAPSLIVGGYNSTLQAIFQVGNVGATSHLANFGRRYGSSTTFPSYTIALFETWAASVLIEAQNFLTIRSAYSLDLVAEAAPVTISSLSSSISISAASGVTITAQGTTSVLALYAPGSLSVTSPYMTFTSDAFIVTGSATPYYFRTDGSNTAVCSSGANATGQSLRIATNTIIGAGQSIISADPSGYLSVGPNVKVCGGQIRSAGSSLQLQGGPTDVLFIDVNYITSTIGLPNRFFNEAGLDIANTPLMNTGIVDVSGCGYTGWVTILDDVFIRGSIYMTGDLHASITCPSDRRVKRDIEDADKEDMFNRIMSTPVKRFKYTEEFQRDPTSHVKANTTYHGVIAQDIAEIFPYAVEKRDEYKIADFHSIHPEMLFAEMIGAMQHMQRRIELLETRLKMKGG
jgi:hypothetical protein